MKRPIENETLEGFFAILRKNYFKDIILKYEHFKYIFN